MKPRIHVSRGPLRRAAIAALVVGSSLTTAARTAPAQGRGPQEGIKVTGEWTIVVQ